MIIRLGSADSMRFDNRLLDEIRARITLSDLVGRRVTWDRRKTPGGSSGGSGAAVAAGILGAFVGAILGGAIGAAIGASRDRAAERAASGG